MPRRGRTASPPPATRRSTPTSSTLPARTAPAQPTAPATAAPTAVVSEQPSLFKQMAATAGGVAVGSAVGHAVGAGLTGLFSGSGSSHEAAPTSTPVATQQQLLPGSQPNEPQGPCAWEIKQFLQCAQNQADLSICEGFNEALRQCKQQNHIY